MIIVDQLAYTSNLRKVNATTKFAFAMITLSICVMSRSIAVAILVLGTTGVLTVYKGGIPLSRYIRLLCVPIVFLILSVIAIIIQFNGTPLNAFSIPVGKVLITASYKGLYEGGQLFCTALSSVSCLYFLALSTPMTDILLVLKRLHCPAIIIELMLLIYRFIFVLLDIAVNMQIAQKSRLSNRNFRTSLKAMGMLMSTLFVRAFQKSSRLYDAMESRCYDGSIKVLTRSYKVDKKLIVYIIFYEILLVMCYFMIRI